MNYLSSVIVAFCVACIIIGALYILCPDGELSKSVRYVLGLSFILSIIAFTGITVKNPSAEFSFSSSQLTDSSDLDVANAKYVYSYALKSAGIDFSEITVCTDKQADGSIVINKVIIRSDCEREKILSVLGEMAKIYEVEIVNE